jgi:FkbM family methyltransferase
MDGSELVRFWSRKALNKALKMGPTSLAKRVTFRTETLKGIRITYNRFVDVGHELYLKKSFEHDEIEFFKKRLAGRAAPVVLDVGANIGWHTINWARELPGGRVHAFEPTPKTLELLRRNIAQNGLRNVEVVPLAVSDKSGSAKFYECEDDAYNSLQDTKLKKVIRSSDVTVTTLDEYAAESKLDSVALIKIDVEGFDTAVIRGAMATIARFKPDLMVEITSRIEGVSPVDAIELLRPLGYRAYVFQFGKPVAYERPDPRFYNFFFTPG